MRTVASIILLIILVPATLGVFLITSLRHNVATSSYLTKELAKRDAYGIAEDQLSQQIAKIELKDVPIVAADLQTLASRVLAKSWLQRQVEGTLTRLFVWFNGPTDAVLALPVDLATPKAQLLPGVDALLAAAIPRLPSCKDKPNDICNVPGLTVEQVKAKLKDQGIDIASVTSQLPDEVNLANPVLPTIKLGNDTTKDTNTQQNTDPKKTNEKQQQKQEPVKESLTPQQQAQDAVAKLSSAKEKYHTFLGIWSKILLVYGVLLLLFITINIHGLHRLIKWIGIGAVTVSTLPLLLSAAAQPVVKQFAIPNIDLKGAPQAVQSAIPAAIFDTVHALFFPILLISGALFVLGIGSIIVAHTVLRQQTKK